MATESPKPIRPLTTAVARPRSLRSERGVTLIELMVTLMLFLGLMAIVVPALISMLKAEPRVSHRANAVQRARTTVEKVVHELRVSYSVAQANSRQLTFLTYNRKAVCGGTDVLAPDQPANKCRVTYTCSGAANAATCNRAEQPVVGSGGSSAQLITGLASPDIFAYSPDASSPDQVRIRLQIPGTAGDDAITLEDTADLRNVTPGV